MRDKILISIAILCSIIVFVMTQIAAQQCIQIGDFTWTGVALQQREGIDAARTGEGVDD